MSALTISSQCCTAGSSQWNQARKNKIKDLQIGKEEVKLSLFTDNMIIYVENLMESIKKLLELVGEFSKYAGYEITIQKFSKFLYTSNNQKFK